MYTAQLWWNHTVYSFHRLSVCYNNILRRLLRRPCYCSASGLFAECGIPNCKAVIPSLIYKFITRLNESTNDVILAILSSDIRQTSHIRRYWVKLFEPGRDSATLSRSVSECRTKINHPHHQVANKYQMSHI